MREIPAPTQSTTQSARVLELPTLSELEECIRCGLCLSVCPTYRPTGLEGDSPRGRIALVKALVEGDAEPERPVFTQHMDRCLQCMACVSVCPTGVNAGVIVANEKAYMRATHRRSPAQLLLYLVVFKGLFPHYRLLEITAAPLRLYRASGLQRLVRASGLLQFLPGPFEVMEGLLPERGGAPARRAIPLLTAVREKRPTENRSIAFHTCCINNVMFPAATAASVRVLSRQGLTVDAPRTITCCGAPHETEGEMAMARTLAKRNIAAYERLGSGPVITDSAACGAALKEYGHWLSHEPAWSERAARFSARVRDIHEFLVDHGVTPPRGAVVRRVTYDDPCHLCHAQGISKEPRQILRQIPGIEIVELPEASWCCGSAGTYNVTQPEMAERILQDKMECIRGTGAEIIASANPGCMLQLESGMRRYGVPGQVRHVMELLDEAYEEDPTASSPRRG